MILISVFFMMHVNRYLGLRVVNVYDIDSKTYLIKISRYKIVLVYFLVKVLCDFWFYVTCNIVSVYVQQYYTLFGAVIYLD